MGGLGDERSRQRPQCGNELGTPGGREGGWWGWGGEMRRICSWVTACPDGSGRKLRWSSHCDRKPLEGVN